jgi:DNA-binding transcriptional MerR regulator
VSKNSVSQVVAAMPMRFDARELADAASQLMRARSDDGQATQIDSALLQLYLDRGLIDAPEPDGDARAFTQHHLLQLTAVQILREGDVDLASIGELLQGVDDRHLKMLCDDPQEAASKAAVMRNWLHMLEKGRYSRAERGETRLAHHAEPERVVADAPPDLAAVLRTAAPVAPSLGLPDDLPSIVEASKLPLTPAIPPPPVAAARNNRATIAHVDPALLAASLGRGASEPHDDGKGEQTAPAPVVPKPTTVKAAAARAPVEREDIDAAARSAPPPRHSSRTASSPRPVGQRWRRYRVAGGVELHVAAMHDGRAPDATAIEAVLERVRLILEGGADEE